MAFIYSHLSYATESRIALIMGNDKYQYVDTLTNAVADAKALRNEMAERKFDIVSKYNADRDSMNNAIDEFLGKLTTNTVGMIFYSGHGVQIDGTNYLIPVDMKVSSEGHIKHNGINLTQLLNDTTAKGVKFTLAVIDACRNNPFKRSLRNSTVRGLAPQELPLGETRGLAQTVSNAQGIMVIYSAGVNQEALDRLGNQDTKPNGLFTREFISAIKQPGLTVQDVVLRVKKEVIAKAASIGHLQTPAIYDQSVGDFKFTDGEPEHITKIRELERQVEEQKIQLAALKKLPKENLSVTTDFKKYNTDNSVAFNLQYTDNGDGTVTNIATGLMWKRCAEGQAWDSNSSSCVGNPSLIRWYDSMYLSWFLPPSQKVWSEFADYKDWQLPNTDQLRQLLLCGTNECEKVFPNSPQGRFWTSSFSDSYNAFYVDFGNGIIDYSSRDYGNAIRLVRLVNNK